MALPHILPCPAPRVVYADGEMPDGTPQRRRRRRPKCAEEKEGAETLKDGVSVVEEGTGSGSDETSTPIEDGPLTKPKKGAECPIPKPGGIVGEMLGFRASSSTDGKGSRPP